MIWNSTPFETLYTSIQNNAVDTTLFQKVLRDLQNLNLNANKTKNQPSRSTLEKGKIKISDGSEYQLSKEFIVSAIKLSDELNLDEIVTCELMLSNLSDSDYSKNDSLLLINNGKTEYYLRRQYILQIVSYIVNCSNQNDQIINQLIFNDTKSTLLSNILPAFTSIHSQLSDMKQMINRAQILEQNDILFNQTIKFRREFLLKEYDILGQILYGLIKLGCFLDKQSILNIMEHVVKLDADDFFVIYYLPALFLAFNNLESFNKESDVQDLYSQFVKDLKSDDNISLKPIKVLLIFVFLTFFISWCKAKPNKRTKSLDFKTDIDEPMRLAVEYGAFEQLLTITADTSIIGKDKSADLYYDIRSLLQRHIPKLIPKQLLDDENSYDKGSEQTGIMNINKPFGNTTKVNNILSKFDITVNRYSPENMQLSDQINSFFLFSTHSVLQTIISDCAFLLTRIKDAEEDLLLSSEDLDLDIMCEKAELERFFITLYFFYASRPEYAKEFLEDKESNSYGFIEWAAKCSDIFMRSCFYLLISSLSYGRNNATQVFNYFGDNNIISWKIIAQCFSDYIEKINKFNNLEQQRNQDLEAMESDSLAVALEVGLNEESIIFLSSLLTLVSSVAQDIDESVRSSLASLFMNKLFELSKLDTPLAGACLKTLSNLIPMETKDKAKFWFALDTMIFKGKKITSNITSYTALFSSTFTNFTEILGFLYLFRKLIQNSQTDGHSFGKLEFPIKLGQGYRKVGIVPYFDFIVHQIFVPSLKIIDSSYKDGILLPILEIFKYALDSFDNYVIMNATATNVNLDKVVVTSDFFTYVQESPATIILNYLLEESVYNGLFDIIKTDVSDSLYESDMSNSTVKLVNYALSITHGILEFQDTYIEELIPIIKKYHKTDYVLPQEFGTHGLRSFYDAIFFNLDIIAHLGLFVGSKNYGVSSTSIAILNKIAVHYANRSSQMHNQNKLLIMLDAVDESAKIKDAFIFQLESPIDSEDALSIKIDILEFLNNNLSYTDPSITVSHFLLGLHVSDILTLGPNLPTFISSGTSLFRSVLYILQKSLEEIDSANVGYAPMRVACICMEILLKLCRNPTTSQIIFDVMLQYGFLEAIVEVDPSVTKYTKWEDQQYELSSDNSIDQFINSPSLGALLSFLSYRSHLIQYLSLFIHRVSSFGTSSQLLSYIDLLISNTMHPAKIFSFLNILGYRDIQIDGNLPNIDSYLSELSVDLTTIKLKKGCNGNIFELDNIDRLLLLAKQSYQPSFTNSNLLSKDRENKYINPDNKEDENIKQYIITFVSNSKLNDLQFSILHSWVQLVQILVSDGKLGPLKRSNFILEIFSIIIPKIYDYVEFDIRLSENLVSLAVFLYDIYNQDRLAINKKDLLDGRLQNLFKVCIHGITSPLSSITLRADFYVLTNQYLIRVLNDKTFVGDVLQSLRIQSERLVEVICNDIIYGEGINRVTALFLLDSLVKVVNSNKENIIFDTLIKNSQLHLIIRSLMNIDVLLGSKTEPVDIDNLLYEITAFKAIIYLLLHISETKNGVKCIIQNKLLKVISEIKFLQVDPDLGLRVIAEDKSLKKSGIIEITLDEKKLATNSNNNISLKELIIPIFQLLVVVLLNAGSQNYEVIRSVRMILTSFKKLLISVFKYDTLEETENMKQDQPFEELIKLIVLLCSMTNYYGEKDM